MREEPIVPSGSAMVETLGLFSSHPRFAPFRLLFWYGFAVAPLVVGIAIIGYWLSCDPRAALSCLVNYGSFFLIYGLAAFVFAVGLGVTAATTTCLARGSRFIHDDKAPWSLVIAIVACLFSVGLLTWLVPYAVGFQPRTRVARPAAAFPVGTTGDVHLKRRRPRGPSSTNSLVGRRDRRHTRARGHPRPSGRHLDY